MPKHEHTLIGQAFRQFQYPTVPLRPDDEVIGRIRDHHQQTDRPPPVVPSGAYRAEVLETLLGNAGRAC